MTIDGPNRLETNQDPIPRSANEILQLVEIYRRQFIAARDKLQMAKENKK